MLNELRNISKNNQVVYATHSNHMIIRDNYDQHLIVKKEKDETKVRQSQRKRIGYFMQEEVLYDAMGVDLSTDLSTIQDFNFVFEGLGDVIVFKHFYENTLKAEDRPFKLKNTKFYQGGKCSDIKKAFQNRPIQLGTKWIFIIDSDKPAEELKKFLTGKYKHYINKDIFVFQYPKTNLEGELEDILPDDIITQSYCESFDKLNIDFDEPKLKKILAENTSKGYSEYSKIISTEYNIKKEMGFNKVFKEVLNDTIDSRCKQIKTKEQFKAAFEKYSDFGQKLIDEIKQTS